MKGQAGVVKILLLMMLFAPFLLIAAGAAIRGDDAAHAHNLEERR
jgi:hypothetical protein